VESHGIPGMPGMCGKAEVTGFPGILDMKMTTMPGMLGKPVMTRMTDVLGMPGMNVMV